MIRRIALQWLAAFATLAFVTLGRAASAFASEAASACSPTEFCFPVHGWFIVDFAVFIGIIVYVGRKPIAAMLDRRYQDVAKDIQAAQELKSAAQARYDEYQARLDKLGLELQRILDDTRKGTQAEMDRILADAQVQVDRVTGEEQQRLAQESKKLRDQLERDAAALALRLAEQLLKDRLDAATQQKLVDQALRELESTTATVAG